MALGILCLSTAVLFMALQVGWAIRFARRYPAAPPPTASAETLPRATVVLSIRGQDPSLVECLTGLLHQDYPEYDISIIVDSPDDPAWDTVAAMLARSEKPMIHACVLRNRQETCSLKVSALVQAIRALNPATEVVALIDADVIPYRHWLRDLVRPLADPRVGATSGIRWYVPRGKSNWGTAVRTLWNAVAFTQMDALHIPWAGSMAFRAELFRNSPLLDQWTQSLVEDTVSYRVLRSLGLRLCHVPAVTMVNHETIALHDCFRFIRRQLLNARLYHESWPVIVAVSVGGSLALIGALVQAMADLASGNPTMAIAVLVALMFYALGMGWPLTWADRQINRLAQARGAAPYPYPWKALLAIPLTQALHLASLGSASFIRKIEWRGITYEVKGSGRVRLLKYQPYGRSVKARPADASLV